MSEIKSFPFPVLSADNADYAEGVVYETAISRIENEIAVTVRHSISGDSWLKEALGRGEIGFACIVSLPSTMYRRIDVVAGTESVVCEQRIDYTDSGYGEELSAAESPMFRPIIIAKKPIKKSAASGLSDLWKDAEFEIPDGGIIAYGEWERFGGAAEGLMVIEKADDDDLKDGAIRVEVSTENGFRFCVKVGGDALFNGLQEQTENTRRIRQSVLIHALSAGFSILKESYRDNWQEHINLRLIAEKLRREGFPHWSEEGFSAEEAASTFYPHKFPATEEGNNGN